MPADAQPPRPRRGLPRELRLIGIALAIVVYLWSSVLLAHGFHERNMLRLAGRLRARTAPTT